MLESALAALEATSLAQSLRVSRWGYAAVNAAHILGIALLVGSATPLALKLLGVWRSIDTVDVIRVLRPVAAGGLILAVLTGTLLFSIQARDYADLAVFQIKLVLIATGVVAALWATRETPPRRRRLHATVSIVCWIGALICGRMIAFVS